MPEKNQLFVQDPATPMMEGMIYFHNLLMFFIVFVGIFVFYMLFYAIYVFHEDRHPVPAEFSHNSPLEIIWTILPAIILLFIAVPSFTLLYSLDELIDPTITLKIVGHQWYWSYEYPDNGEFTFDAAMLEDEELEPGQPRLLATDEAVVIPVNTNIRLLIAADDVLHAWAMPAFGIKLDGVPGRLNETWVRVEKEGTYYGQCSELCGTGPGFMPIMVKVVSKEAFATWAEKAKEEYASLHEKTGVKLADANGKTAE